MILAAILALYTLVFVCISAIQIAFLQRHKEQEAVILDELKYKEAATIGIENEKFKLFSQCYNFAIGLFWIFAGFLLLKELFIASNSLFENSLFLLAFLLVNNLLNLPLHWYESFVKNKKQGFSTMNLSLFIKDNLKSLALLCVFGFLFFYALLFCYEFLGQFWWLYAFVLAFFVLLCINLFYPTLIAPLFNKMTPLDDENLRSKISVLMQKCGFSSKGVFVMDASKRDTRLNAYFGGLFKNKRVVLFDTLLKALSQKELLAVLGHELGHFVHKDLIKALFGTALVLFIVFFVFAHLPEFFYTQSALDGVKAGVFALFFIFGEILLALFAPFLNFLSRKNEFNADKYGALMTSKEDMKKALLVLAKENKAFVKTARIYEFFHHSHPSIYARIKALA